MDLRPGMRLFSTVCETSVLVIKSPRQEGQILCGGAEMVTAKGAPTTGARPLEDASAGTMLGKRYICEETGLEVLCTKPGAGSLAFDKTPLVELAAKPLPPSD